MYVFKVPRKSNHYISKDHAFRVSFSAPLSKKPPRLSKEGYIRALEVYGREDILFDSLKSGAGYFNDWREKNPGDLDLYRRYANSLGYDWERGSVTDDGIYTSYVRATAVGAPSLRNSSPSSSSDRDYPGLPTNISQFIHTTNDNDETAEEESMRRNPNGRFDAMNRQQTDTPRRTRSQRNRSSNLPSVLQGAPGNMRFVSGGDHNNALGAASLLQITLTMLRGMVEPEGVSEDEVADVRELLNYVGPAEETEKFLKALQTESPLGQRRFHIFSPTATTPSTQRILFPLGSTPRKRNRFLEELEEEGEDNAVQNAKGARREEDRPYICNDQLGDGATHIDFSTLYVGREAIPTTTEVIAQHLGRFHEAVIKEAGAVTLSQSMGMLGISSGAILQLIPRVPVVENQETVKEALQVVRSTPQLASLQALKQLLSAAGAKYEASGWSPTTSLMPEIVPTAITSRQATTEVLQEALLINGRAAYNAPVEVIVNGITKHLVPVTNVMHNSETTN